MKEQGLVRHLSRTGFAETVSRLVEAVEGRGLTLFARFDHGAAAREAGLELRDTMVLVFGNPRGGTPLMAENQETGIDLPLHLLVWTDVSGQTHLAYDAPDWIARRHRLSDAQAPRIAALAKVLDDIARTVAR